MSYTESQLRDYLSNHLDLLEPNLKLVGIEYHIPFACGSSGRIDILATDYEGNYVIIEIKKSSATAREAVQEVFKYYEILKEYLHLASHEIRLFIVSTHWNTLLIPFSVAWSQTNINLLGYSVELDNQNKVCRVSKVDPVSINHERSLTIEDCLYEYSTYEGYLSGLKECEEMWKSVGINDYVVIGFNSEKVKKELKNKIVFPYSIFNLVALQDKDKYLDIINKSTRSKNEIQSLIDILNGGVLAEEDILPFVQSQISTHITFIKCDEIEFVHLSTIKSMLMSGHCMDKLLWGYEFQKLTIEIQSSILNELQGNIGQESIDYHRTITSENRQLLQTVLNEIRVVLRDVVSWRQAITDILINIQNQHVNTEYTIQVDLYNPMNIFAMLRRYFAYKEYNNYLPYYKVVIIHRHKIKCYEGRLEWNERKFDIDELVNKYYSLNSSRFYLDVAFDSYLKENMYISRDMGITYENYMTEIGDKDDISFYRLENCGYSIISPYYYTNNTLLKLRQSSIRQEMLDYLSFFVDESLL